MTFAPVTTARELIDIPSPTGQELAVGEFLERKLLEDGFECRRYEVAEARFNHYASAGGRPRVILCSHLDTVPPFYGSSEDEQFVYGRGACDTKGIIAAMLAAGSELRAEGVRDFAFLFVVGEETDSIGAKRANQELASIGSEYVIVGEPTESRFVRASKGALTAIVHFKGLAAHSAYPERGDSAIRKMTKAIDAIERANWGEDPVLGKSTVNIGLVRGGEKANIVPSEAEAQMIFRTVSHPDVILGKLGDLVAAFDGAVTYSHGNEPMQMFVPEGEESVVVAFNTDVPHLRELGKPLLFGPGSILDAHTAAERIAKDEMLAAVQTYRQLVTRLLEGN